MDREEAIKAALWAFANRAGWSNPKLSWRGAFGNEIWTYKNCGWSVVMDRDGRVFFVGDEWKAFRS